MAARSREPFLFLAEVKDTLVLAVANDGSDDLGATDSWSTYWYNGYAYVNGGLDRVAGSSNRGFEAYAVDNPWGTRLTSRRWHHLNPQTQEVNQVP